MKGRGMKGRWKGGVKSLWHWAIGVETGEDRVHSKDQGHQNQGVTGRVCSNQGVNDSHTSEKSDRVGPGIFRGNGAEVLSCGNCAMARFHPDACSEYRQTLRVPGGWPNCWHPEGTIQVSDEQDHQD